MLIGCGTGKISEMTEGLSDEERAKRRANYPARLDSEGHTWVSTDPAEIAEAYARMAELGRPIVKKPETRSEDESE